MATYSAYQDFAPQAHVMWSLNELHLRLRAGLLGQQELLPVLVFTAFSIEAYVNSLGERLLPAWEQMERNGWRKKIEALYALMGQQADWAMEPLAFAIELFEIRNRLAHGKTERIVASFECSPEDAEDLLDHPELNPVWFRSITVDWTLQSAVRYKALIEHLRDVMGQIDGDPMAATNSGFLADGCSDEVPDIQLLTMNMLK